MQTKHKINWRGYISITVVCLAITIYLLIDRNAFGQTEISETYKLICDAFFVPGIIFTCFGTLLAISNEGFFDIFTYSFRMMFDTFTKSKNFRSEYETYFDYTRRNRESNTNVKFALHVGLVFVAISIIFNLLFYATYVPEL